MERNEQQTPVTQVTFDASGELATVVLPTNLLAAFFGFAKIGANLLYPQRNAASALVLSLAVAGVLENNLPGASYSATEALNAIGTAIKPYVHAIPAVQPVFDAVKSIGDIIVDHGEAMDATVDDTELNVSGTAEDFESFLKSLGITL